MNDSSQKQIAVRIIKYSLSAFVALTLLSAFFGAFYTVDEGERAVVLRNGQFHSVEEPGLKWKVPFVDSVHTISMRAQKFTYGSMSGQNFLDTRSRDEQRIRLIVSVNVVPTDARSIYTKYGDLDALMVRELHPKVYQSVNTVIGGYTTSQIINDQGSVNSKLLALIQSQNKSPIAITSFQIEHVAFSDTYNTTVEERQVANAKIETEQNLKAAASIRAERQVIEAKGKADSQLAIAKAEAEAIKMRGDALRANQQLVELTLAEKWNGQLPTQMVPGSSVPFINVK